MPIPSGARPTAASARTGASAGVGNLNVKLPPYWPSLLVVAAVAVALLMAYRLWRELHEDDEPASTYARLSEFEEAHAAGELDEDELRGVREALRRSRLPAGEQPRGDAT